MSPLTRTTVVVFACALAGVANAQSSDESALDLARAQVANVETLRDGASRDPLATALNSASDSGVLPVSRSAVPAGMPETSEPVDSAPAETAADEGPAYPPSPLQTFGAIGGALAAIALAIAGVTFTFRAMRNESRRGRGRSRRSGTTTLPQT